MTSSFSHQHGNAGHQANTEQEHGPVHAPDDPVVEVRTLTVLVNYKEVQVLGPRTTGAGIKEAAIAQGVAIQPDFVLSLVREGGSRIIVHDDAVVTVTPRSEFVAVGPDDNS